MRTAWRSCARRFGRWLAVTGSMRRAGSAYPLVGIVVCLLGGALAFAFLPASGKGAADGRPISSAVSVVRELPELRTANSDTYLRSDGSLAAKISRAPINYRDASGSWQPINTTLQPSTDGSLEASTTQLPISLPSSLSSPVTVGGEGATVSFSLEGAGGSAAASGSTASYAEALPQVTASYEAQPARLKETLTLASAAAPSVYHYHLSTTGGLSPKLVAGTVVFSDGQGRPRYVMQTPTVADSGAKDLPGTRDVRYDLSADGSELNVVVSSAWLSSPDRVFPVRLDPTLEYWGDEIDCVIANGGYENTSLCGGSLSVGHKESPSTTYRDLLRFNLGTAIRRDAVILRARLALDEITAPSSAQILQAFPLKTTPTNSATWNTYDGTHAWAEKGGDFYASPVSKLPISTEWTYQVGLGLAPMIEGWIRNPETNHGLILKAENETTPALSTFASDSTPELHPYLEVLYSTKTGTLSDSTFTSQKLTDREGLSVNVANGNLLVQNHILELPGIGSDLSINALFNSRNAGYLRSIGAGWSLNTGIDVRLELNPEDESRTYRDPSGAWWRFDRNPAGDKEGNKAFTPPPGINTSLVEHSDGTLTLEYLTARVKYQFDNSKYPSYLQKIEDANKNTTTMHYNSKGISSIEDTHGHTVTFKYNETTGYVTSIKDAFGRSWAFTNNASKQLTTVKDPDLQKSKFTYEAGTGDLKQIEDPTGDLIELSYDSLRRIKEIRHVINGTASKAGTQDVISTFAYVFPATSSLECPVDSIGDTEVVSPNGSPEGKAGSNSAGHKTFYCFNNRDQVIKAIDQAGNPSTAGYDAGSGSLIEYQNPGDMAGGGSGIPNKLTYNSSGALMEVVQGTSATTSLKDIFNYGTEGFAKVEPSSARTPFSASKQKEEQHTTFYGYDTAGNLASIKQGTAVTPELNLTSNALGQPTSAVDGNGNETKLEYNTGHDLVKIVTPAPLGVTELTYDSINRLRTVKDGRGITSTYTYDGEDRVTRVEYSDGTSVSFEFDANGNTLKRTDASGFGEPYTGVTSYEYDKLNRPALETTPTAKTSTYTYDYDGNLVMVKDTGGTSSYAYGPDDVLTNISEPENASRPFKFGYETGNDNRESTLYPNGMMQCSKTDAAGRLITVRAFVPTSGQNCSSAISPSAELQDFSLSYTMSLEGVGTVDTPELQTLTDNKASSRTVYTYDASDRIERAVVEPSGGGAATLTSEYGYDNAGNMLVNHTYSPTTTYTNNREKYNAANEICAIATSAPPACAAPSEPGIPGEPTYDADGDMTSDGTSAPTKFAYTARDQLSSITPHGGSASPIVSHGTGQGDLAAIGTEEVVQNIVGVASTGTGSGAKYYTRDNVGGLLARRSASGAPSETEYYLLDPSGSPSIVTNASAVQVAPTSGRYQYDAYGGSIGTAPTTFGANTGQTLPGGLLHYGARYYEPGLGSWTQREAASYAYADDDPVNGSDPSGACFQDRFGQWGPDCASNPFITSHGAHVYKCFKYLAYHPGSAYPLWTEKCVAKPGGLKGCIRKITAIDPFIDLGDAISLFADRVAGALAIEGECVVGALQTE
jgi:RHS repeat-associated protein